MDNASQVATLKELASYTRSDEDNLSNDNLKVLYSVAKHVFDEVSDASTATLGCGLGKDYMKTAATIIGSDDASLTAKHNFAKGVQSIKDQNRLYAKTNNNGGIKLCMPKDFISILQHSINKLENGTSDDETSDSSSDDTQEDDVSSRNQHFQQFLRR